MELLDLRSSLFTLGRVKVNFALLSLNQSLSAAPGLANAVAEGTVAHGGGVEDDGLEFRQVNLAVGVVPMIIAQSAFWMPVGVTIFAGGIGSLILVVTVLPVVYWKVSTK